MSFGMVDFLSRIRAQVNECSSDLFKLLREEEDLHWDALSIAFDASGSRLQR